MSKEKKLPRNLDLAVTSIFKAEEEPAHRYTKNLDRAINYLVRELESFRKSGEQVELPFNQKQKEV